MSNLIDAANRFRAESASVLNPEPRQPYDGGGGGGNMEQRVRAIEKDVVEIRAALSRIETELKHKPSYGGMLGMMIALVGLVVAAAFGGASFGG